MLNSIASNIKWGAIVTLFTFPVINVWACPTLSGVYECPDDERGQAITSVEQTKKGRITSYIIKAEGQPDEEFIADNKTRTIKDGSTTFTTKSKCQGNTTLVTAFVAVDADTELKMEGTNYIKLGSNKSLLSTTKGKATIGDQVIPFEEELICTLKTK